MDREKVIKGLQNLRDAIATDFIHEADQAVGTIDDALALLKDDETQLQYRDDHIAMYQAEINRLESMLKEQETELCDRCGRRRMKSSKEGR